MKNPSFRSCLFLPLSSRPRIWYLSLFFSRLFANAISFASLPVDNSDFLLVTPRYLRALSHCSDEWNTHSCVLAPAWGAERRWRPTDHADSRCLLAIRARSTNRESIIVRPSSRLELDRRLKFNDTRESNGKARVARSGVAGGPFLFPQRLPSFASSSLPPRGDTPHSFHYERNEFQYLWLSRRWTYPDLMLDAYLPFVPPPPTFRLNAIFCLKHTWYRFMYLCILCIYLA